jgi:tetratricopeptide (TPR) repeat protein
MMIPFYVSAVILLFRGDPNNRKAFYLFPYFLIVFLYFAFRSCFFGINGPILKQAGAFHAAGWEYPASLFQVLAWYTGKLFYPRGIVMQWATPILHDHIIWNAGGACLLFMVFLLLFVRCSREKILQMAVAWFLIGFVPVCLAAFRRPENGVQIEPHWFIFSSIGFFILASYFCLKTLDRTRMGGLALLFIVIFAWSATSHAYNQVWADQKTYARFWSQQAPDLKVPYFYLAVAYQKEKDFNDSVKYYKLALNGYTSDADIYVNMGLMDEANSDWKEAELNFRRVLKINPLSAAAYHNLGVIYLKNGQWEKARKYFIQALVYNPLMIESRGSLAFIFASRSEYEKAIDLCLKNLDIVSDDTETLFLLIDIYIQKKDLVNIRKYAYRIVNDKNDPEILTRLGVKMEQANINDVAIDCYIKALRVAPDYKDAYFEAGKLLDNLGKHEEALHIRQLGSELGTK